MSFENFPYSNFHELNLDWILQKLKEAYSSENPPDYPVKSVNGQTGDVIIAIPSNFVQSVNGETGDVVLYRNPLTQFPATDEVRWNLFRICDGTEKGIEFDDNGVKRIEGTRRILIYDEDNPPDYPVTSVNGQTGDVQVTAGVQSVNGKTGAVVTPFVNPNTDILALDTDSPSILWGFSRNVAGGNVALYITTGGTNPQAFIRYTPTDGEAINLPLLTTADIPSGAGVVSINGKSGVVTIYGTDIMVDSSSSNTIAQSLNNEVSARTNADTEHSFDIAVLNDSIFTKEKSATSDWRRGAHSASAGESITIAVWETTVNYINSKWDLLTINDQTHVIYLQAWDDTDTYIGLYNPITNNFETPETFTINWARKKINLAKIKRTYPTYKYRPCVRRDPSTPITNEAAECVDFYYITADNEIKEHSQQITALQTSDTTQNQQISALQTSDTTQNQQISALQTAIGNIQTGSGIKEVKLSEVVTLPARYPETGTDADIKTNMACVNAILSRPGVQRTNFTVEFFDGYLTISGTMQGLTDIILYLTEV